MAGKEQVMVLALRHLGQAEPRCSILAEQGPDAGVVHPRSEFHTLTALELAGVDVYPQ